MIQLQLIPIRHFPLATVSLILHFSWLFPPIISTMLSRETLWICKCFCRNKRLLTDGRTQWLSLGVDMFSIPHVIWLVRVSGDYNTIAEHEVSPHMRPKPCKATHGLPPTWTWLVAVFYKYPTTPAHFNTSRPVQTKLKTWEKSGKRKQVILSYFESFRKFSRSVLYWFRVSA